MEVTLDFTAPGSIRVAAELAMGTDCCSARPLHICGGITSGVRGPRCGEQLLVVVVVLLLPKFIAESLDLGSAIEQNSEKTPHAFLCI